MEELRKQVEKLADEELKRANEKFPLFNSAHEGWAVMFEEEIEAQRNMKMVHANVEDTFEKIMKNQSTIPEVLAVRLTAIELACEAIQVAAMAEKFMDSLEVRHE